MQQLLLGGFTDALDDSRFQGLVKDFHAARPTLTVRHEAHVKSAIAALLDAIVSVLADHSAVHAAEGRGAQADSLDNTAACLQGLHDVILSGPLFMEAVTVFWLFHSKLDLATAGNADDVIRRLDEFLVLLGVDGISVQTLWEQAQGDFADHRDRLWAPVDALLQVLVAEVAVKGAPSVRSRLAGP